MFKIRYTTIMQFIGLLASIVGIVCFYTGYKNITLICGSITLIDSFFQVISGEQNGLVTEIFTIIVGLIIALIFKIPIFACIALALCIATLLLTIIGWISLLMYIIKKS